MKAFQIALIVAFLLPLGNSAMADSRPAKKTGSSSYKSGFASPRAAPPKNNGSFGSFGTRQRDAAPPARDPAPAAPDSSAQSAKPRGGFGAFGAAAGAAGAAGAADNASRSAMSKDLEQNQAKENALKTLDARRAAANGTPPLDNPVPGVGQRQAPAPDYRPQPPPVVVQQGGGNGWSGALFGFMLGRAMNANAHQGYYPPNGAGQPGGAMLAPAPQPSFGSTVLRTFAWLVLLGVIGWLVYFVVRAVRRSKAPSSANYTFERD